MFFIALDLGCPTTEFVIFGKSETSCKSGSSSSEPLVRRSEHRQTAPASGRLRGVCLPMCAGDCFRTVTVLSLHRALQHIVMFGAQQDLSERFQIARANPKCTQILCNHVVPDPFLVSYC